MVVFDLDGNKGNVGFSNTRNVTNNISDKMEQLTIVARKDLNADICVSGGIRDVTDGFVRSEF